MKRNSVILCCVLFCSSVLKGQNEPKNITEQNLVWLAYFNTVKINSNYYITSEIQERRYVNPSKQHQLLFRSHLHKKIADGWDVSVGITYFLQSPHNPYSTSHLMVPEWRPHVQMDGKDKLSKRFSLQHRYRMEKRFFRNNDGADLTDGYNSNYRFRYRLGVEIFIMELNEHPLSIKISDEIHINAGKNIVYNHFDQNRIYVGLNYEWNKNISTEIGYMNWYQQRATRVDFYDRNIVRILFFHKLQIQ